MHELNGYLYAVVGGKLYRISSAAGVTELGDIAGSGNVRMSRNETHLWIATNDKLYAANQDEILELPEKNFVGVTYQDGYLIGAQGGGQKWFISAVDDATSLSALDFTSADALPGTCVGIISDHREVHVFKTSSIEVYYNSGASAFPFARTQVIERGCASGDSIAKNDNMIFFLGNDLRVYGMGGYQPQVISNNVISELIEARTSPQTAVGFTYQQGGHVFYVLTFSDLTLVYDITTGKWHKRISDLEARWRVNNYVWIDTWRKHLVGDFEDGNIYTLEPDTYDEDGAILRRRAQGAPLWNGGLHMRVDEFMLDIETGVGLVTGQGSDPQVVLDWSSNGGKTWSNQLWRSFGKMGEYDEQVRWHMLGRHRQFTPRITITDPVPVRISGAYVRAEMLAT
jgi:hypothetical protein